MSATAVLNLSKAGFTDAQVQALAQYFDEQVATKADIEELRLEIGQVRLEIEKVRSDLTVEIEKVRSDLTVESRRCGPTWNRRSPPSICGCRKPRPTSSNGSPGCWSRKGRRSSR